MIRLVDILKDDCVPCTSERNKKLIYKLIEHAVYNWPRSVNEAYNEGTLKKFIEKFKQEAEDFNIRISDDQLKKYILRFDDIKNSPKIKEKDLNKYTIKGLIRLATSSQFAGDEEKEKEEEDKTPDVVYQDNGITIWNGARQENCVTYGAGEKWCITRPGGANWAGYRYGGGEPTFYLAKNNNLPSSNKLSFVALQVLNDGRYKFTNRTNSPGMEGPFEWNVLLQKVPWLADIPNIKNILKYIPLSSKEKITNVYKNKKISYTEWAQEPFSVKKQYILARAGNELFDDISDDEFVEKYLSKYPQIATVLAELPGVVDPIVLVKNLDKFSDGDRKSITRNMREKIDTKYLKDITIPFDIKKLLTKINKWNLKSNERLYVTKDGSTIVKLELGDNIKISLFTEEDDYPNIKLNKRTSKFLLDYPELDKLPLKTIVDLAREGALSGDVVKQMLQKAKENPQNSSISVKPVKDGEIVLDSQSLTSFKVDKNGDIEQVPFSDDDVQQAFEDSIDSPEFKKGIISIFGPEKDLSATLNKEALINVVDSIPYSERISGVRQSYSGPDVPSVLLTTPTGAQNFFFMVAQPQRGRDFIYSNKIFGYENDWRRYRGSNRLDEPMFISYFEYLRRINFLISDENLVSIFEAAGNYGSEVLRDFITSNPPVNPQNRYKVAVDGQKALLIDSQNPRNTRRAGARGGLVQNPITVAKANQLLGIQAPQAQQGAAAQQGARRLYWQQPAPEGNINVGEKMTALNAAQQFARIPDRDRRRLNITNAAPLDRLRDGGARRRNQLLGNAGVVREAIAVGTSRMYIIRLRNGQDIISIKVYPGNREYLLIPGQTALQINEPGDLVAALRQRNLVEAKKYLIRSYLDTNPTNLEEFKQILRKHINRRHE